MYSGSDEPDSDLMPRSRMVMPPAGSPEFCVIWAPGTLPCSDVNQVARPGVLNVLRPDGTDGVAQFALGGRQGRPRHDNFVEVGGGCFQVDVGGNLVGITQRNGLSEGFVTNGRDDERLRTRLQRGREGIISIGIGRRAERGAGQENGCAGQRLTACFRHAAFDRKSLPRLRPGLGRQ